VDFGAHAGAGSFDKVLAASGLRFARVAGGERPTEQEKK
jgi:hypothetical protein